MDKENLRFHYRICTMHDENISLFLFDSCLVVRYITKRKRSGDNGDTVRFSILRLADLSVLFRRLKHVGVIAGRNCVCTHKTTLTPRRSGRLSYKLSGHSRIRICECIFCLKSMLRELQFLHDFYMILSL